MHSVTVVILLVLSEQAHAKELVVNRLAHAQRSGDTEVEKLVNKLVDKAEMLVDRALKVGPLHDVELDKATLAKGKPKEKKYAAPPPALHVHFPGALPGAVFHERLIGILKGHGFTRKNTIFGTSICPSEINTLDDTLVYTMQNYFDKHNFLLGGLGGAPFAGKSGFNELESHVPNGGNVVILFGSHVGLTASGEIGKFLHDGQHSATDACDAVVEAYEQCVKGEMAFDVDDMEESWLRQQIAPHINRIKEANNPMAELAKVSFEAISMMMKKIANTDSIGSGNLVLLGGIQINMPEGHHPDYFLPLHFTMENKDSSVPKDMLESLSKH